MSKVMSELTSTDQTLLCPLASYGLLSVTGDDARSFLQGQLTANVNALKPGDLCYSAHCEPTGKTLSVFWLYCHSDNEFWLILKHSAIAPSLAQFEKYGVFNKVTFEDKDQYGGIYRGIPVNVLNVITDKGKEYRLVLEHPKSKQTITDGLSQQDRDHYKQNKVVKKKFSQKYFLLSSWPRFSPQSCISIKRNYAREIFKVVKIKKFNSIWFDFRLAIYSYLKFNKINILKKYLTYYRKSDSSVSSKYQTFAKNWWIRRSEAHDYFTFISKKLKIKDRFTIDKIITKMMNLAIK